MRRLFDSKRFRSILLFLLFLFLCVMTLLMMYSAYDCSITLTS
ncbi:MAG: hypothetical protein ACOYIC_05495 [Butyricicoccus sp.]|jgi:hypothetical protein